MVSEPVLRMSRIVNVVRSEEAPLLALVPPTEQLGSLRKAHRNNLNRVSSTGLMSLLCRSQISQIRQYAAGGEYGWPRQRFR